MQASKERELMCKRNDAIKDPLAKLLFGRYGLHLLSLPRSGIRTGEVFIHGERSIVGSGDITTMFEPGFALSPAVLNERAIPLEETQSNELEASAALNLLDKLFAALGFGGSAEVRAAYSANRATKLRFKFASPTRDSLDIIAVTDRLFGAKPKAHQWGKSGESVYLVTGVLRSRGISISATTDGGAGVDVIAKVKPLAEASGKVKVSSGDGSTLTYSGHEPLGFGVELVELSYDATTGRVDRRDVGKALAVRSIALTSRRDVSFIGDEDTDIFIDVKSPSPLE